MIPCKPHRRIDQADKGTLKMTQSFILYTVFYENGTDYFLFSGQIPASPHRLSQLCTTFRNFSQILKKK